jgi:hypothetical protein
VSLVSHEGGRLPGQFPDWPTSRRTPPASRNRPPAHPPSIKILGDDLEPELGLERGDGCPGRLPGAGCALPVEPAC